MKRLSITASGRVQGVGYRYFVEEAANALGVTGWVRNACDGTVELEAQGDPAVLSELCRRLEDGPPLARVRHLVVVECPLVDDETSFDIRS